MTLIDPNPRHTELTPVHSSCLVVCRRSEQALDSGVQKLLQPTMEGCCPDDEAPELFALEGGSGLRKASFESECAPAEQFELDPFAVEFVPQAKQQRGAMGEATRVHQLRRTEQSVWDNTELPAAPLSAQLRFCPVSSEQQV